MTRRGFQILPGEHPIAPVMLGDAVLAGRMAEKMLEQGVYVVGFSYPVVPQGKPASAPRSPPGTRELTWSRGSRPSPWPAVRWSECDRQMTATASVKHPELHQELQPSQERVSAATTAPRSPGSPQPPSG